MELNIPDTVDHIFRDFKARREALIDALTNGNVEEVELLCHRGFPDEMWNIDLPRAIGPPHFPKPPECINIARDSMQDKDWLALVAAYCDAWLLSISFFFAAKAGFDKAERDRLFYMINDLPSISEVVTTAAAKNESSDTSKALPNSILDEIGDGKYDADAEDGDEKKDEEDDEDENENGGHVWIVVKYAEDGSITSVLRYFYSGVITTYKSTDAGSVHVMGHIESFSVIILSKGSCK